MTGIAVGLAAVAGAAYGWWGLLLAAAMLGLAAVAQQTRLSAAASAVVLVAALVGAWRGESLRHPASAEEMMATEGPARVITAPERGNQQQQFVVVPDAGGSLGVDRLSSRQCVLAPALPKVRFGDRVRLSGQARARDDVAESVRLFLTYKSCATTLFATSVEITGYEASAWRSLTELRGAIGEVLRTSAPGDAGVLLAGLVTGEDTGLSDDRAGAFIRTGTTHLTAVSGSNLALVAGMLATTGMLTVGRHRVVWQLLTLAGIWGYALISGAQSPVVRAALVASAAVLAFRVGRRPDFVTLVLLAAGIMVVVEPQQVEALGFRLSVASSLALAVIVPPLLTDDRAPLPAVALMATVAAQIATLPLLLPVFGVVSLTSLPANIAAAPLAAVAMPLAALAAVTGLVWQPLGELIAAPANLVATVLLGIVDRLGAPYAIVEIGAPTTAVAVVIAATAVAVLLLVSVLPRK